MTRIMRLFVSAMRGFPLLSDTVPMRHCIYIWWPHPGEFFRGTGEAVPSGGRIIRVLDVLWSGTERVVVAEVVQSRIGYEVGTEVKFGVVTVS